MRTTRVIVVAAMCFSIAVAVSMTWRAPSSITGIGYEYTHSGPLGPADKDLLSRVKQAGLWEMPLGEQVSHKAKTPRLKEIGMFIHEEHDELNRIVDEAADQLDVELPEDATVEQRAWVDELSAMPPGMEYDKLAVHRLREAHGNVLPLLAQVYVSTRNDTVRNLADEGMTFVNRHINYLESTELVNHALLPEPPQPKPLISPVKASYYALADRPTLLIAWLVMFVSLIISYLVARTLVKDRRKT